MRFARWIPLVAAAEAAVTGLLLIVRPSLFSWLIFGSELPEPGPALGRVAGIVMLCFGFAFLSPRAGSGKATPSVGPLLVYNVLATLYLGYLGIAGQPVGPLLWPAVAIHPVLAALLVGTWRRVD